MNFRSNAPSSMFSMPASNKRFTPRNGTNQLKFRRKQKRTAIQSQSDERKKLLIDIGAYDPLTKKVTYPGAKSSKTHTNVGGKSIPKPSAEAIERKRKRIEEGMTEMLKRNKEQDLIRKRREESKGKEEEDDDDDGMAE